MAKEAMIFHKFKVFQNWIRRRFLRKLQQCDSEMKKIKTAINFTITSTLKPNKIEISSKRLIKVDIKNIT